MSECKQCGKERPFSWLGGYHCWDSPVGEEELISFQTGFPARFRDLDDEDDFL